MRKILQTALIIATILYSSCQTKTQKAAPNEVPHVLVKKLTDIIVVDIFTPPVASRIYANCTLAMYEAMRNKEKGYPSVTEKLNGFDPMPTPLNGKTYDFTIAGIQAFCETAKKVTFSADEIKQFQDSMLTVYKQDLSDEVYVNSISFGQQVADVMGKSLATDNYKETRGMDRFEVQTEDRKRWVPTSPDYGDALEPHWLKMKTLALKSPDEIRAAPFADYNEDTSSAYYKELKEVYDISKNLSEEQIDIAIFWDDNPFVSRHKGHVMFQDKKMTPGGHWMAITRKACRDKGFDMLASTKAYTYTAIGLYDAFISCWYEKYRSVRIRPQTAIQRLIEEQWFSYIQTPPFPEYTSGHSTVSASAAEMLTHIFGDNHAFTDSSELEYNLPVRSFSSFRQAALEASVSRVYGGIHYRSGCENGNLQGRQVAALAIERLEK
jgi:hypothetical protein